MCPQDCEGLNPPRPSGMTSSAGQVGFGPGLTYLGRRSTEGASSVRSFKTSASTSLYESASSSPAPSIYMEDGIPGTRCQLPELPRWVQKHRATSKPNFTARFDSRPSGLAAAPQVTWPLLAPTVPKDSMFFAAPLRFAPELPAPKRLFFGTVESRGIPGRGDVGERSAVSFEPSRTSTLEGKLIRFGSLEFRPKGVNQILPLAGKLIDAGSRSSAVVRRRRQMKSARTRKAFIAEMVRQAHSNDEVVAELLDLLITRDRLDRKAEKFWGKVPRISVWPSTDVKGTRLVVSDGKEVNEPCIFKAFKLVVGDHEYKIVPELYAKLAATALFNQREGLLLKTLKAQAVGWLKMHNITFEDGHSFVGPSVYFAFQVMASERKLYAISTLPQVRADCGIVRDLGRGGVQRRRLTGEDWSFKGWFADVFGFTSRAEVVVA